MCYYEIREMKHGLWDTDYTKFGNSYEIIIPILLCTLTFVCGIFCMNINERDGKAMEVEIYFLGYF
jgi:hypothetical protein